MEFCLKKFCNGVYNWFYPDDKPTCENEIILSERFLWFPRIIDYKLKWLQYAKWYRVSEEVYEGNWAYHYSWRDLEWIE